MFPCVFTGVLDVPCVLTGILDTVGFQNASKNVRKHEKNMRKLAIFYFTLCVLACLRLQNANIV